jgi:hypothetical protein
MKKDLYHLVPLYATIFSIDKIISGCPMTQRTDILAKTK